MKTVLLDIQNRLSHTEIFRYVGEDWGQLNLEQPPVNFPCALIDLENIQYSSAGKGVQQAEAVINISIADIRRNGVSTDLPGGETDTEYEIFSLIDQANNVLHGHGGEEYTRLCRLSLKKIQREDALRLFVLSYKFSYTDKTAIRQLTKSPVPPHMIS